MESCFLDMNINVTTSAVDVNANMEKTVDFNLFVLIKLVLQLKKGCFFLKMKARERSSF